MPFSLKIGLFYFGGVSLAAVFLTVLDKSRARRHKWRIPEAALLFTAALGGAAAMLVTMKIIRHKTQHRKFMWGLPALLLLHIAAAAGILSVL